MARDNFSKPIVERLAKRVGMKCSNPDCRQPTAGPDTNDGVTNIGVAAHITAASPGGPRFDSTLTAEQRADIANGIWLCQSHAKLVDDDELAYPAELLRDWKHFAEKMAAIEARGFVVKKAKPFATMERKIPNLISEMRTDLNADPLIREFFLLSKNWAYNPGSTPFFTYFYEDHDRLDSMITIMEHFGAAYDITFNDVKRYNFSEDFVEYALEG